MNMTRKPIRLRLAGVCDNPSVLRVLNGAYSGSQGTGEEVIPRLESVIWRSRVTFEHIMELQIRLSLHANLCNSRKIPKASLTEPSMRGVIEHISGSG